jgi:putative FmdB family regulatory protein
MPLFEYHCETCGQDLEVLQRDSRVLQSCGPECVCADAAGFGEGKLTKKLSAHAVLSGGSRGSAAEAAPMCGACGGPEGSCAYES